MEWEDVDELVKEVTELGHSRPKTPDEEWLPPELKLETAPVTIADEMEVKEGQEQHVADHDVHSVPSQKRKRGRKTGDKISKSAKNTYPISCPRCALVSSVP